MKPQGKESYFLVLLVECCLYSPNNYFWLHRDCLLFITTPGTSELRYSKQSGLQRATVQKEWQLPGRGCHQMVWKGALSVKVTLTLARRCPCILSVSLCLVGLIVCIHLCSVSFKSSSQSLRALHNKLKTWSKEFYVWCVWTNWSWLPVGKMSSWADYIKDSPLTMVGMPVSHMPVTVLALRMPRGVLVSSKISCTSVIVWCMLWHKGAPGG